VPEPGQTPQPTVKQGKGPDALPWGEAAQINDAVGLIPPEEDPYQPQGDAENFLYSPTDRPQEPATAGLPYGPGANGIPQMPESDGDLVHRVAAVAVNDPAAPSEMKAFAQRALKGM
jgi:hypothetical protein